MTKGNYTKTHFAYSEMEIGSRQIGIY